MSSTKILRSVVSVLLLGASAAATLLPDWAAVLKAQGYYGSVDLQLSTQLVSDVHAGTNNYLMVTLANAGPDDAHGTRIRSVVQGPATVDATFHCNEDPLGYPLCTLAPPLPAGGSAGYLMQLSVPPLARGTLTVALAAQSWDTETAPGQETALLELPIKADLDLRASAQCDRRWLNPGMTLSCQVVLYNAGPAAALAPQLSFDVDGASVFDFGCNATRAGLCPAAATGAWSTAVMAPTDTAVLWFELAPAPGAELVSLHVGALGVEAEDYPADNAVTVTVDVPLFRDDFEGTPPRAF